MDWAYIQEVGNVLFIVDAGSGWIEAFICGNRPTEKVIHCLSAILGEIWGPTHFSFQQCKRFYQRQSCHVVTGSKLHQSREPNLQSKE